VQGADVIKTVIKLAFVALIANATWHLFVAYSPHVKFKDGVQYAAQYRGDLTDEGLRDKILRLASQFDVPVTADDVSVTHQDTHTIVQLSYVRPVDLAPGFTYPWPFSVHLDTFTVKAPGQEGLGVPK
jgi:putative aminopeptidase FrvX